MPTTNIVTPDDLSDLFTESPSTIDDDRVAALTGLPAVPSTPEPAQASALTASKPETPVRDDDYAWTRAFHLVPEFSRLLSRYPAIGLSQHPRHGLVLVAAYLEDTSRRVRRNLKFGDDLFFAVAELEVVEPETKALKCRVIIKTLPHQVGMRIRYWENTPAGDVPGKSGAFIVTERGLERLGHRKGRS